ncbi:hypothetical protein SUGI_0433250 [Cryptomeria japonica]|nr:hypothetical protein SUGI_0433250 [Cryptomeria japonica]
MPMEVPRRRKKKRVETYEIYIYKVLQEVNESFKPPCMGISRKAMNIMNSFACDLFEQLAHKVSMLIKSTKTKTLTSWPIQKAVDLVLPYELGESAHKMGRAAVMKFVNSNKKTHKFSPASPLWFK